MHELCIKLYKNPAATIKVTISNKSCKKLKADTAIADAWVLRKRKNVHSGFLSAI